MCTVSVRIVHVICVFIRSYFPGKTLLAKAVANQTAATFLRVVGSELIQKYLVREKMTGTHTIYYSFVDEFLLVVHLLGRWS